MLSFNVPEEKKPFGLFLFIHNKDQMYFPKIDKIFGSEGKFVQLDMKTKQEGTGQLISQYYAIQKTHWKALDTPLKRCRTDNVKANTTQCLTHFLEHKIGCSVSLSGSDSQIKR